MANTNNNYFGTTICKSCNIDCNKCSCKAPINKTKSSFKNEVDPFPPVPSDISTRQDIKQMEIFTNLEAVRDLEFCHEYISDQIEKFAISPILCNNCNDLSRHFLHPAFYTNELYVKNSKWIINSDSKLTMDMLPYNQLTIPIYDVCNVDISHPANRPRGKIHLCREASNIIKKNTL